MQKNFLSRFLNLSKNELYFVVAFFVFVFSLLAFTFYFPNYNDVGKSKIVDIRNGETLNNVIIKLYKQNIIPSKTNMKIASFLLGADKNIKAGSYKIPDGISYVSLVSLLLKGEPRKQKLVTIQEGIWHKDLGKLLHKELGIDKKEFLKLCSDKEFIKSLGLNVNSLVGYLLPETNYFYEGSSAKEVIKKLSEQMQKIFLQKEVIEVMRKRNLTEHQILTMASIIDGESNKISEFKRISGVYYNRLKNGWKLQADPTVQYVARQRRKKVNKIYYKDLEIDSKYNTYKYYGLPPTPINHPGKEAIMASLYPEEHDYFYFVADGKGGHNFSKSGREHQQQVNRYRNWRKNR